MNKIPMYRVLWSQGLGTQTGPSFRYYRDALRYVQERSGSASFAIQKPNGRIAYTVQRQTGVESHRSNARWPEVHERNSDRAKRPP